jgi:hypothetical protein
VRPELRKPRARGGGVVLEFPQRRARGAVRLGSPDRCAPPERESGAPRAARRGPARSRRGPCPISSSAASVRRPRTANCAAVPRPSPRKAGTDGTGVRTGATRARIGSGPPSAWMRGVFATGRGKRGPGGLRTNGRARRIGSFRIAAISRRSRFTSDRSSPCNPSGKYRMLFIRPSAADRAIADCLARNAKADGLSIRSAAVRQPLSLRGDGQCDGTQPRAGGLMQRSDTQKRSRRLDALYRSQ